MNGSEKITSLFPFPDEVERSAALAHVAFAEKEAAVVHDLDPDAPMLAVDRIAVIGAGTMGAGIAMAFANIGLPVTLIDVDDASIRRGMGLISRNYAHTVSRGRLDQTEMDRRVALIEGSTDLGAVGQADLVIEAVFEDMDLKCDLFRRLDVIARNGAILATNTSALDIDQIASVTRRPQYVIGAHFFSPANVMRLLEVIWAKKTSTQVVATLMAIGRRLGKIPVLAKVHPGFIGNAMLAHYFREAMFLVEDGATPRQVDKALTDFGYAMGFFTLMDMTGNDVDRIKTLKELPTRPGGVRYPDLLLDMWELERLGQKTGKGYYRYEAGDRTPLDDPEMDTILARYRERMKFIGREVSNEEILERCLLSVINEGANLVGLGVAQRPSDVDAVYVTGYGFPAWRGGPLYLADQIGVGRILERVEHYHQILGDTWKPAPLLKKLGQKNGSFAQFQKEQAALV